MKRSFYLLALLFTMVQGTWADDPNVYLIDNLADWEAFCADVNSGTSFSGKTVKLTNNISGITTMAGTEDHPFVGTFDGDNYELEVNITSSSAYAAPFARVGNATFLDLYVRGSVKSTMMEGADHTAGLIGKAAGVVTITNVRVEATITGHTYYGGFIGHGGGSSTLSTRITMAGCVFQGKLNENQSGATQHIGGFIGWGDYMTIDMSDCMFDGEVTINNEGGSGHHNFHPIGYYTATATTTATLDNVYYKKGPSAQNPENNGTAVSNAAKMARLVKAGTDVTTFDLGGSPYEYVVANIIGYDKGMKYDLDFYAGNGDKVGLILDHTPAAAGKHFKDYTVSGGGTITEQGEMSATLSMSDNDQTISAEYDDNPANHVFLADDAEAGWTLPTSGSVSMGTPVTVNYSGEHKVKSVTARPYRMAAEATAEDKGKLICCHGHIHEYGKDTQCDAERHAMIVYVSGTKGMALGTTDVNSYSMTWHGGGTYNNNLSPWWWCDNWNKFRAVPGARWRETTKDDIDALIGTDGANGYEKLRDSFEKAGGTNMHKAKYWTNNFYMLNSAYAYDFSNGQWCEEAFNNYNYSRAVLVFSLASGSSPSVDVTMNATKEGDTYNYSGTFKMPAYDVEVSTGLYYKLGQTATNNASTRGTKKDVYLERTLQTGGWNTFCAPFDINSIPTGWTVKKLVSSAYDSNTKVLTLNFANETTKIAAGTPYLVKVASTVTDPEFANITQVYTGEAGSEAYTANPTVTDFATFTPVLTPELMTGGDKTTLFVVDGNKLTYPSSTGYIYAFRGYFRLTNGATFDARSFVMNFDDETTSLPQPLQWEESPADAIYDLQGRKIANGQKLKAKGIYIQNGRKVIMK